MANVPDYPVTTPYGYVPDYPLNNGFHTGIDYGCPVGTPVVVNGVTIGLSGNTGASTGPHCHVGRYVGGDVTNPGVGNGFTFKSAKVTEISEDSTNGKYVRVQGDGASWVYLHLSNNSKVSVGQVLQGGTVDNDIITKYDTDLLRIIYACIQDSANFDAIINQHSFDDFLKKNLTGSFKSAVRNMFANSASQANLSHIQKALANPGDVIPYSGPQLYQKKG